MEKFIARNRIVVTRWSFGIVILLVLFTSHIWPRPGLFEFLLQALGFVMIVIAVFGRLWSSVFICGYKTKEVIQYGPYSITRNPLYVFSFIGAVGFGLVTRSLVITALIIFIYVFIYARTVASEEKKLEEVLGVKYLQYKANTPRFFPDLTLYRSLPQYTINVPLFEHAFKDAVWFFLGYGALQIIDLLHRHAILPVLFRMP
ncbi:MAG: isoprenylcysteine carboxylmethyltransferase family protein [Gammaproteobacteria bacterium]|nr:isoprenylcysteine carboxylmethyltransferase family protein [Gammaproteobacteria bacterium]